MGRLQQYHEKWAVLTGEAEVGGETVDLQAGKESADSRDDGSDAYSGAPQ